MRSPKPVQCFYSIFFSGYKIGDIHMMLILNYIFIALSVNLNFANGLRKLCALFIFCELRKGRTTLKVVWISCHVLKADRALLSRIGLHADNN